MTIRGQLTLFVQDPEKSIIENIRKLYNPIQFDLIGCHVTLCREDELSDIDKIMENLSFLNMHLYIKFSKIKRFSDGKGLMLEGDEENFTFHEFRNRVLKGVVNNPRTHNPHITLMHPRNSTCNDEIFNELLKVNFPTEIGFNIVSLIKQENDGVWKIIKEFR